MGKIIKTVIGGIPVELELLATENKVQEVIDRINKEAPGKLVVFDGKGEASGSTKETSISTTDNFVKVVSVGSDQLPAKEEDIAKIKETVSNSDANTLIANLLETIQNNPEDIALWQSKTFWVNVIALLGAVATYFGKDLKLTPEAIATISTLIVLVASSINVYLRKGTNRKIKSFF